MVMAHKFVSFVFLILQAVGSLCLNSQDCPRDWKTYEGSCYLFSQGLLNWTASQANCSQFNAHLVTISSARENDFLIQQIMAIPHSTYNRVWLGLSRSPFDNNLWLWIDGSQMVFTNWRPGQPDNSDEGEACGELYSANGQLMDWSWNDNNCTRKQYFICEKEHTNPFSCFSGNGGCDHTCVSTLDGPVCKCKDGYISSHNGKICLDPSVYRQAAPQAPHSFDVASFVLQLLSIILLIPVSCVLVSFYRRVSRQRRMSSKTHTVMINPPTSHADGGSLDRHTSTTTHASSDDVSENSNMYVEA